MVQELFELKINFKKGTAADLRPQVEGVLRRHHAEFELRASADDAIAYAVNAPADVRVDRISRALESAARDAGLAVEWDEKKQKVAS